MGAMGVAGCGSKGDDEPDASGSDSRARALAGRTLVVTSVTDGGKPHPLVPDSEIRLRFEERTVSVSAGCNAMNGGYQVDGDKLVVGDLAMTQMGCPEPLMAQDAWLAEVLAEPLTIGEQELRGATVVFAVADRADVSPDVELTAGPWQLDSLIDADSVSSVAADATVSYDGATLSVDTGCNTGRATASRDGDLLTVGPLMLTKMACPDPAGREVESAMLKVLDGAVEVEIEERRLTLSNPATGSGLGFVAQ
ncbi:META domain-containing protein [Nocardioides sp. Bht2]|uniref:META domain-containing protein n=1 Tax=Nocardioides sp. Bht2 TaxID=3392297 RepID=UPI0039B5AB91